MKHLIQPGNLPQPWQKPIAQARLKSSPADFIVEEVMTVDLSGQGEHLWLKVQKCGMNTDFLASQLAKWAGIPKRDVGFSGLKDRHAVTTQWFSLRLPTGVMPDNEFSFSNEAGEWATVLEQGWHNKKLNRGTHTANRFVIVLRELNYANDAEQNTADDTLRTISQTGVPNYFGEQRFGRDGNNINETLAWFSKQSDQPDNTRKKSKRRKNKQDDKSSIWLSTARSAIFNQILAQRVIDGTWQTGLEGEVFNLAGTGSVFGSEKLDDELQRRLATFDIHPTGAMWGKGMLGGSAKHLPLGEALKLEQSIVTDDAVLLALANGLEAYGIKPARRPLRLMVHDLSWNWLDEQTLNLDFALPSGSFATSVVSSLVSHILNDRV